MNPAYLESLKKYVQYIRNTANVPLKTAHFDDDWEPIGPQLRRDLQSAGYIMYDHTGGIILTNEAPQ